MFLENYTFKYSWRKYQASVLAELEKHIADNKINVVAAPGAGKTVLGLEIIRQLNENVLILSPTITIKNQWMDRFLQLFVQDAPEPDFISHDIYNLKRFNVATYQALHYAYNRKKIDEGMECEEESEVTSRAKSFEYDLIAELKAKNIKLIVLDEAHHLRTEWWKSLTAVLKTIENIRTISLTATPPYDVDRSEWNKYIEVCGTIDCEISVPELVATEDLCPHQDFVIFNKLSPEEEKSATNIKAKFDGFIDGLKANREFINAVASTPELSDYYKYEERILDKPRYYSSLLIFLNAVGEKVDRNAVKSLGGGAGLPQLNVEWIELMLQGILFDDADTFARYRNVMESVQEELSRAGGIEKKKVMIKNSNDLKKLMASSIGKMDSIVDIARSEYANLKDNLSMVVLADYIRGEALEMDAYNKIGVIPIFKKLVKAKISPNIAVLSGKLKIVPKALIPYVQERVAACNFDETGIEGFVTIKTSGKYENELVGVITNAVVDKKINIIIGTVALLGEGWDCPAVNSLILSSFVGSFMLSNQMRGRAIRSNKNPDKVANIWHLVSITKNEYDKPTMLRNADLSDYMTLKRRFKGFVGIAYEGNYIQNGLDRLDIINEQKLLDEYKRVNSQMYQLAAKRSEAKRRWREILDMFGGEDIKMVHTLEGDAATEPRFKWFAFLNLKDMLWGSAAVIFLQVFLSVGDNTTWAGYRGSIIYRLILTLIIIMWVLRPFLRLLGHYNPVKNMRQVGSVVLTTMQDLGNLTTHRAMVTNNVEKYRTEYGSLYVTELRGATAYENNLFIKCVQEVYARVDNQRYIIMVRGIKPTYFNVPAIFCDNKTKAERFHQEWQKRIGKCKLIYTRSQNGRKILMNARKGSFDYNEKFFERQRSVKQAKWK